MKNRVVVRAKVATTRITIRSKYFVRGLIVFPLVLFVGCGPGCGTMFCGSGAW